MSRFEQQLERDLGQIADRATPSPDAWASIQHRIADQDPIHETEIIMLTDNTIRTKRWPLFAAAAAVVALLVGGLALASRDDGAEVPAEPPPTTVAVTPEPEAETPEAAAVDAESTTLPAQGTELEPGRYSIENMGVPVSFDLPASTGEAWTVQVNDDVAITLGHDQGFVNMSRIGSFYDAEQAQDPEMSGLGSIPADDIDRWIEVNGVNVDERREVAVGDRSARLRQVRAPEGAGVESCPPDLQPCVGLSSASADLQDIYQGVSSAVYGEFPHSYWIVELDDFEPLAIWVHNESPDTEGWLDQVMPLIDSIEFGEPAPAVEGGTARLPERIAVTGDMTVTQTGERDISEPWPIERTGPIVGDINGTFDGTGMSSPNGAEVTLDWVMDVTIEGLGSGTLTLRSYETWTGDGATTASDHVIDAAGELAGVTGFGTTTHTDDGETFTATIELMLAPSTN